MKYWKRFEYRVRDTLRRLFHLPGVERVPLSGRLDAKYLTKGDIMNFPAFVEVKSTMNKTQFTIRKEFLEKLVVQAKGAHKYPMLIFSFHGARELYAILPLKVWAGQLDAGWLEPEIKGVDG